MTDRVPANEGDERSEKSREVKADNDLAAAQAKLRETGRRIAEQITASSGPILSEEARAQMRRLYEKSKATERLGLDRVVLDQITARNGPLFDVPKMAPVQIPEFEPDDSPQRTAEHTAAMAEATLQTNALIEQLAKTSAEHLETAQAAILRAEKAERLAKWTTFAALGIAFLSLLSSIVGPVLAAVIAG